MVCLGKSGLSLQTLAAVPTKLTLAVTVDQFAPQVQTVLLVSIAGQFMPTTAGASLSQKNAAVDPKEASLAVHRSLSLERLVVNPVL